MRPKLFQNLLNLSVLPIDFAVSSTHNEVGDFVKAVSTVSVEEVFVRLSSVGERCGCQSLYSLFCFR